jgi:hypothetical protein
MSLRSVFYKIDRSTQKLTTGRISNAEGWNRCALRVICGEIFLENGTAVPFFGFYIFTLDKLPLRKYFVIIS